MMTLPPVPGFALSNSLSTTDPSYSDDAASSRHRNSFVVLP